MAASLTIEILTDVSKAVSGIDQVEGKTKSFGSKMGAVARALGGAVVAGQNPRMGAGLA